MGLQQRGRHAYGALALVTCLVLLTVPSNASAETYAQAVEATSGLAHFWPMGESSGSSLGDVVGEAPATTTGGVSLGEPGGLAGDESTSVLFDGSSGAASAAVDLSGTHELTVEFWMKSSSFASDDRLALEFTPNFNENSGGLLVDPDATPGSDFAVAIGSGGSRNTVYFTRPSVGAWHHYAFVIDTEASAETQITPYVDAKAVSYTKTVSGTGAGNFANSTLFWMSRDASSLFGSGDMQDLALYTSALSAGTIADHYEIGAGGPKASFTSLPVEATVGVPVRLDASGATSPTEITDYAWDFDGGGGYGADGGGSPSMSHTFSSAGTYTVELRVKDSTGTTATVSHTITVGAALGRYEQGVESTSGIEHFWPMGESSGSSFADVFGGADASLTGGVSLGETGGLVGDSSSAALFDGSSGAAHAPVDLSGSGKQTVEFWMKWHAFGADDALALEFTPNFNENAGGFLVDPNAGGSFGVGVGKESSRNNSFFGQPSAEAWHYYAFVIDTEASGASEIVPYVDGHAVSYSKTASGTGGGFADSTLYWMSRDASSLLGSGDMQDLALYSGALSSSTIATHYEAGKGGPKASFASTPVVASVGVPVRLDASASSSPGGSMTDYAWDFDGSKSYSLDGGGSASESHTFSVPGTYTIDLRVKDSLGETATTSQTVTVGAALGEYEQAVENRTDVAHFWPMGESSGSSFADLVGGDDASLEGGVTLGQTGGLVEDSSTASLFDGSSGAAHATVDLSGTHQLTVEFWMKWSSYGPDDRLALEFTPNFNEHSGGFLVDPDATPGSDFAVSIGLGGTSRNSVFFERPSAGAWHYYAFAIDASAAAETQITPYVDGHAVSYTKPESGTGAGSFANSTLYWMSRDASSLFGAGDMQDLALYDGTLSAGAILEHYEHGENTYRVANTTPPSIEGIAQDGKKLTVDVGAWSGVTPISYAYQWQSCNSGGGECEDIEGATDPSYALTSADLETKLRVRVTATNPGGSAEHTSAASFPVESGPPDELEAPLIGGEPDAGETLYGDPGLWGGTGTELSYQWEKCNATGGECADIAGASGAEYELVEGDIGATLRLRVGASNDLGSVTTLSRSTPVIGAASLTPANNFGPSLFGTVQGGQTLTVSPGAWTGVGSITYAYAWERCDAYGSECEERSGEHASSYALETEDVGHTIRALVTTTDANGSLTRVVGTEQPVAANPGPLDTQAPSVAGAPVEGQALHATPGAWSGTGTIGYAYQWQRCDEAGEGCAAISGATSASYTLVTGDVGSAVRVLVTATDEDGSSQGVSSPTPTIGTPAPLDASLPSISGVGEVGEPLSANSGIWSGEGAVSFSYQWRRCNEAGEECSDISGATHETYVPSEADTGKTARVVVTADDPSGSASATSAASAPISATPMAPTDLFAPAVEGALTEGDTLTAAPGTWYGSEPISYAYQWQRCDEEGEECANISGATGETHALAEADVNSTIRVIVTATNSAGSESAESSTGETVDAPGPPAASDKGPAIRGEGQVGQHLFAENGSWTGSRPLTYAYRWERCDAAGETCTAIAGATAPSYTPASEDASHTLRLAVTAENTLGHTAALTPAVPVAAAGEASTSSAIKLAEETDPSVLQPSTSATIEEQEVKPATSDPGEELAAITTLTSSSISKETPGEFAVNTPDGQLSLAPVGTAAGSTTLPTIVNGTASVYAQTFKATDTIVRPEALGASALLQLHSAEAPTSFSWEVGLGPDQYLEQLSDGSVAVVEAASETFFEEPSGEPFESTPESTEASEAEGVGGETAEEELEDLVGGESPLEKLPSAPQVSTPEVGPKEGELHPQETEAQYEHGTGAVAAAETHTGGRMLMVIQTPTVIDAVGDSVSASLSVDGDTVTLAISAGEGATYPITAQTSVAAPTDQASTARGHTIRYGLSDPKTASFTTAEENGETVAHFDTHLKTGPMHVGTARLVLNYNTPPDNPTLEAWLKAVHEDGLQPYITLWECHPKEGFPACPPRAPSTTVYRREITKLMKGLIHGNSEKGIPPVSIWGAWNEPDNPKDPLHSTPSGASKAAYFWQVMQKTAKEVGCHCTVVAGEFTEYHRPYIEAYRKTILKSQIYWPGKPHVWGLHDYRDLKYFHSERRNTDVIAFDKLMKANLGHPHIWLSELGVELQDNNKWTSLVGHPSLQREAANDFLHMENGHGHIERQYYYLYSGPTQEAMDKNKTKHVFDSALLHGEGVVREGKYNAENPRQAYCVLLLGEKGCPAKSATLVPISGTVGTTAGQTSLTVDPGGLLSTYWVEYGTTTAYGHSTPAVSTASEDGLQSESASIEGLEPCTTYHYQAEAENEANEGGASLGGDRTFTTRCEVGIFLAREGGGSPEIWETDPAGSMPHAVGLAPEGSDPSLSPDGQSIAYSVNPSSSPSVVRIRPLAGGTSTTVYSGGGTIGEPTWSPDGTKLIFAVRVLGGGSHIDIDGVDTDGSDPKTLVTITGSSGIFQFPSYSPDGSKILFLAPTGGGGAPEVNVANADGSGVEAVTSPSAVIPEEHPRFSPDGTKIVFSGSLPESVSEEYNQRIYTINDDGSGLTELTHGLTEANEEWAFEPEWTPDGSKIIYPYELNEGGSLQQYELYVVNADGSDEGAPFLSLTGLTESWGMSFAS
jgi:Tol biopolymer transport system component